MPTYLRNIKEADRDAGLGAFLERPAVARLGWPPEVVEQWLFDHGRHPEFLDDYGTVDLSIIHWRRELAPVAWLADVETGPSEHDCVGEFADDHVHYLSVRPADVRAAWEEEGTWLVPPILISKLLLEPPMPGLQLVEGRMRVGIFQGRLAAGLHVSHSHEAWVGRPD